MKQELPKYAWSINTKFIPCPLQLRGLDQDRNHTSSRQSKFSVPKDSHQTRNSARMASQTQNTSILTLIRKHLLQQPESPHIMLIVRLPVIRLPQLILFSKALLNRPLRLRSMNLRPRAPAIARMLAHNLSRHLLNRRPNTLHSGARPLQTRSLQAPHQRARHPGVRHRHFLVLELLREESACVSRLLLAYCGQVRVDPVAGSVAVELAPVVVPGFGTVEGFGYVVVAFAVAGAVEEFVGCA
jgi:hypothetical protein